MLFHKSKNWKSSLGVAEITVYDVEYSLGVLMKIIEGFHGVTSVKFANDKQSSILVEFTYGPMTFGRLRSLVHVQAKKLAAELHGVQDPVPAPKAVDATSVEPKEALEPEDSLFTKSLPPRDIRMTDSDYGLHLIGEVPIEGLEEGRIDKEGWPWLRLHSYGNDTAVFALSRMLLPHEAAALSRLCEFNGITVPEVGDETFTKITLHVTSLRDPFVFGFLDIMRRLHWVHRFGHGHHAAFPRELEMVCTDDKCGDERDKETVDETIGELPLWTNTLAQSGRKVILSSLALEWLIENLPEEFSVSIG
jgi:hypothetical protein